MSAVSITETVTRQAELAREGKAGKHAVIFLHIGKTAGTTLSAVLRQRYWRQPVFAVDSHDPAPPAAQLARLDEATRVRLRLVRGHAVFGIHTVLPQSALYVTLLRNPYARLLSTFEHVKTRPGHRLHDEVVQQRMGLEAFVGSGLTVETDNWQTRCIAGDVSTPFGGCSAVMLEKAKANIHAHFAFVGLSDRFDESAVLLARMYRWRKLCYVPLNRGGGEMRPTPHKDMLSAIQPYVQWDVQLYRYTAQVLDNLLDVVEDVRDDLIALRRRNTVYYPVGRAVDRAWQPMRVLKERSAQRRAAMSGRDTPRPGLLDA